MSRRKGCCKVGRLAPHTAAATRREVSERKQGNQTARRLRTHTALGLARPGSRPLGELQAPPPPRGGNQIRGRGRARRRRRAPTRYIEETVGHGAAPKPGVTRRRRARRRGAARRRRRGERRESRHDPLRRSLRTSRCLANARERKDGAARPSVVGCSAAVRRAPPRPAPRASHRTLRSVGRSPSPATSNTRAGGAACMHLGPCLIARVKTEGVTRACR